MYLNGMPDLAIKIHEKSYDAKNPRDLARCRRRALALVECGKSLSSFHRGLIEGRL